MNLENKIALITGSTRGIGKSIAKLFVNNNATVIICGRNIESSKKTIEELSTELKINKDKLFPLELDISNKESIKNAVDTVIKKFKKIDILINNAGITSNVSLLESTDEEFLNFVDMIKSRSIYDFGVTINAEDHILTLSTCYGNGDQRMVVHAKLIPSE